MDYISHEKCHQNHRKASLGSQRRHHLCCEESMDMLDGDNETQSYNSVYIYIHIL